MQAKLSKSHKDLELQIKLRNLSIVNFCHIA